MEVIHGHFKDRMTYDQKSKTGISVRDGYLEYAGHELGKEPADKIFKVFRSPATIANVAGLMKGIPLTDEHVDLDMPVEMPKGKVSDATMIDFDDESTHSRLAIKNIIDVDDEAKGILDSGKRELSLGYTGVLVESENDDYDFEQRDIKPHHLAIVDQGRCGSMCSFIDKKLKETDMNKRQKQFLDALKKGTAMDKVTFLDAEGAPNMQEIVDMTIALPEAIKAMPIDELKKLAPKLQAIVANAGVGEQPVEDEEGEEEAATVDEDAENMESKDMDGEGDETKTTDEGDEVETKDEEGEEEAATVDEDAENMESKDMDGEGDETKTTDEGDEVETKDEDGEGEKTAYKDSAEFKDAVAKAVDAQLKEHTDVIVKARDFVDEKYDFKGKSTNQIMRDALAVEHGTQQFADGELPVAFKLLKQSTGKYANFADGNNKTKLSDLKDKEL